MFYYGELIVHSLKSWQNFHLDICGLRNSAYGAERVKADHCLKHITDAPRVHGGINCKKQHIPSVDGSFELAVCYFQWPVKPKSSAEKGHAPLAHFYLNPWVILHKRTL